MDNVFERAIQKIKELEDSIYPTIKETFDTYGSVIKEYQTEEQLYKGKKSDGSDIRDLRNKNIIYKPITISIKLQKGQPIDRVTWKDTGRLYRDLKVTAYSDYVEIKTSVPYAKKLFEQYGNDILGIQKELLLKFTNNYILPNLKRSFNDKITKS